MRAWLFLVALLAMVVVTYVYFVQPYIVLEQKVHRVLTERSTWKVTMQEYLTSGPLAAETYRLQNDNGATQMYYSATDRNGTLKYFNVPLAGPQGTFLFQALEGEGIWELEDKAVRPDPKDEYIIVTEQTFGNQGGSRAFGFSDPHYWATTNAREFKLVLPKGGPSNAPLGAVLPIAGGQPLRDDRYLKVVQMIKQFGPPSVQQAENQIRYELLNLSRKAAGGASKSGA